jgi:hypothetical protein
MQFDLAKFKADPLIQGDPVMRIDPAAQIKCTAATSTGSVPGTQLVRLRALDPDVCVLGYRHLHSVLVPKDPDFPTNSTSVTVDPRDATLFPVGVRLTPNNPRQPGQFDLRTGIGFGNNPGGPAAIAYQFVLRDAPNFTVMWTNSNGALKEGKGNGWDGVPADGTRIVNLLRSLPLSDVYVGTISTANYPANQLRDTIMYAEAIRAKIFIPGHHTTGTIGAEGTSAALYVALKKQFEIMENPVGQWPGFSRADWPDFRWITDPVDYGKPMVFDPKSKEWARNTLAQNEQAHRVREFCSR